jgi:hypothetical protein
MLVMPVCDSVSSQPSGSASGDAYHQSRSSFLNINISHALGRQAGVRVSLCTGQPGFSGDEEVERVTGYGQGPGHEHGSLQRVKNIIQMAGKHITRSGFFCL